MAVNPPKTFADVPDGPMLMVFGYLSLKDRVSLSQTCRRLRHLAINESALGSPQLVLSSHSSAYVALLHRARNLKVTSKAALQAFILGYCWLAHPKWPITRLELCTDGDSSLLEEKFGALVPSVATLLVSTDVEPLVLDSPALINCTELLLEGFEDADDEYTTISVAPSVFAALPNLRKFAWCGPTFTSAPPGPSSSPFRPLMGNLVSLTLSFYPGAPDESFISQFQSHTPNLRHLVLEEVLDQAIPSAEFDVTTLESLELKYCYQLTHLPDGIGRLTRLTRLVVEGCGNVASISPAIGSLSRLQSLVLWGSGRLTSIPAAVLSLTRLTELRVSLTPLAAIARDLSRLHGLKV